MTKTNHPFRRIALAFVFYESLAFVSVASNLTFSDTWKDTGAYDSSNAIYYAQTKGSFNVNISLPLGYADLGKTDADTQVLFEIGPVGAEVGIVAGSLGDATKYTVGGHSATFPVVVTDPESQLPVTNGSVTISWSAGTVTVTGSSSSDVFGEEQMFSANSDGFPTNSLIGGMYEVFLAIDASANGGGAFYYDNQNVSVSGKNTETEYNPPDGSGPIPLENGSISGTANLTPPTLTIQSPTANFKVFNDDSTIELKGTADDSHQITNLQYFVNGDFDNPFAMDQSAGLPANSLSWTASVDLSQVGRLGSNLVTVVASDGLGNEALVSRVFYWLETNAAMVSVSPQGAGTVKGLKAGQPLQVGTSYPLAAAPANSEWLFSSWTDGSGAVLSSSVSFNYVDTDGQLTANFVPNPFYKTGLAGTYCGLFYDLTNGVASTSAGYINLSVTPAGGYSGKLYLASVPSPFALSGQLSQVAGSFYATAEATVSVSKTEVMAVNLLVATDTNLADVGAGTLDGWIVFATNSQGSAPLALSGIQGELSASNIALASGRYNLFLTPGGVDPASGPGGFSYATAQVAGGGAVSLVLNLADGVSPAISYSTSIGRSGACPVFASLYGGSGVMLGWMRYATNGSDDLIPQVLTWVKPYVKGGAYPNGFTNSPVITGALYIPPPSGFTTNVLGWTNGLFQVNTNVVDTTVTPPFTVPLVYNPAINSFSNTVPASKVAVTLTASSGALVGSFVDPAGSRSSYAFHGLVVGAPYRAGYGFFTSTNKETGSVLISPQEP
jgi:hypothetical protein